MSNTIEMRVSFTIDVTDMVDTDIKNLHLQGRVAVWETIFRNAQAQVLENQLRALSHPTGNVLRDEAYQTAHKRTLDIIRQATDSAEYTLILGEE